MKKNNLCRNSMRRHLLMRMRKSRIGNNNRNQPS